LDDLKKQAEELGIKVDGRWSAERLQAEIDEKLAADPEPEVVEPAAEDPAVEQEEPVAEPETVADPVEPEPEPEPEPELSAEDKAAADAEIEAEIQARFEESQAHADDSVVVTSLIANPMKVFGLAGEGSTATFTRQQLAADSRLTAKLQRALDSGMVTVE